MATEQHLQAQDIIVVQFTSCFFAEVRWTSNLKGWRFLEGVLGVHSPKRRRREVVNVGESRTHSRSRAALLSDPLGTWYEAMVVLETRHLIG